MQTSALALNMLLDLMIKFLAFTPCFLFIFIFLHVIRLQRKCDFNETLLILGLKHRLHKAIV